MKTYISIDRERIARNQSLQQKLPVVVVEYEDGRPEEHYSEVRILGPSIVKYDPENKEPGDPSPHAWVETSAELECK